MAVKKRNPQDATLRNSRAATKANAALKARVTTLEHQMRMVLRILKGKTR